MVAHSLFHNSTLDFDLADAYAQKATRRLSPLHSLNVSR